MRDTRVSRPGRSRDNNRALWWLPHVSRRVGEDPALAMLPKVHASAIETPCTGCTSSSMNGELTLLETTSIVLCAASLCATFAHHLMARLGLRGGAPPPPGQDSDGARARPDERPAISVLKPLCGAEEGLYENLRSIALQSYPRFEVVFGVADARDPALAVVRRIIAEHPGVAIHVVARAQNASVDNPKIGNLLNMLQVASHEHILISDSNVRVRCNYLDELATAMAQPGVGLVSSVIVGQGEASLGASLENLHLNTFVAGSVCLASWVGRPCVIGKSMMMRRSELQALGGLVSMRSVLAEDYMLGQRYAQAGHRVLLSRHAVLAHNRVLPLRRFLSRHLRWAQLRRWGALPAFLCEPLLYPTPLILSPALVAGAASLRATLLCSVLLLARVLSDALLARAVSGRTPALRVLALLPLKDCALLAIWSIALLRRRVSWRGTRMWIGAGTIVSRIAPRAPRASHLTRDLDGILTSSHRP